MLASLLHQVFGLGKIPKAMVPVLEQEGIIMKEEGISGSVTFRNFRAPWKRYGYRRNWFLGSIVITEKRFAAFQFSKPIINVSLEKDHLDKLRRTLEGEDTLCVQFDAADFHEDWSGAIACRFTTPDARLFLERLGSFS